MNKNHWRKIIRQCKGDLEKVFPKFKENDRGISITLPMKPKTISRVTSLAKDMGFKI